MPEDNENLYLGIDLGTTNSVAAWGQLNEDGKFVTRAVELTVLDYSGASRRKTILPSCVYFSAKQGEPPVVGEYARRMLTTQSRRVLKSVKSDMGTDKVYKLDEKEYTPAEISSIILKQLAISAKEFCLGMTDDSVITVPASFDTDQREDTNKAAEMAGFKLKEDDGKPRNILLNEPTAALYDFLNRQDNGEIPKKLIDLSEPKIILVFDLGGGTLDVSLHCVKRNSSDKNSLPYDITPYAISRHTLLGGDNFDLLLQEFFINEMGLDIHELDDKFGNRADLFRSTCLDAAEQAKIALNNSVDMYRLRKRDYNTVNYDVILNNIAYTGIGFDYTLTIEKYREILKPFLAPDLSIDSLEGFEGLSNRTENIIYPILDVLNKARIKLGKYPKIDAVLMNGGMSKLFAVRERIEEFFGFAPLEVGDPDLAVARGAAVYHYWRHLGVKTPEIQNDDIGIELYGGIVHKLIKAGTTLPFESEIFQFAVPENGTLRLDLPFYKGTRPDTLPPNKRIATRRIRFGSPQAADTPLELKALVNEAGTMSLKVWNPENPDSFYSVDNVHTDSAEDYTPPAFIVPPGGFNKPEAVIIEKTNVRENMTALTKKYIKAGQDFENHQKQKHPAGVKTSDKQYTDNLKDIETRIISASNSVEAVDTIDGIMRSYGFIADRAARLLGKIGRSCEKTDKRTADRAHDYLKNFCNSQALKLALSRNIKKELNIKSTAIQALSLMRRSEDEQHFLSIYKALKNENVSSNNLIRELCYALGRTSSSADALNAAVSYINSNRNNEGERISAYWAVGRIASREKPENERCPVSALEKILPEILPNLQTETHEEILRNSAYAVGEICDQRIPGDKVSKSALTIAEKFLNELQEKINQQKFDGRKHPAERFIEIALNMMHGEELNIEQKEYLLKLRTAGEE